MLCVLLNSLEWIFRNYKLDAHSTNTLGKDMKKNVLVSYPAWVEGLGRKKNGGARGVMVIVVGNGHGDMSSNPGQDWLHFT